MGTIWGVSKSLPERSIGGRPGAARSLKRGSSDILRRTGSSRKLGATGADFREEADFQGPCRSLAPMFVEIRARRARISEHGDLDFWMFHGVVRNLQLFSPESVPKATFSAPRRRSLRRFAPKVAQFTQNAMDRLKSQGSRGGLPISLPA